MSRKYMSDEGCVTTQALVWPIVEKEIVSYYRLKTQKHSVSIGLYCFGILYEHSNR